MGFKLTSCHPLNAKHNKNYWFYVEFLIMHVIPMSFHSFNFGPVGGSSTGPKLKEQAHTEWWWWNPRHHETYLHNYSTIFAKVYFVLPEWTSLQKFSFILYNIYWPCTCIIAKQGSTRWCLSVCPSVCLSVCLLALQSAAKSNKSYY